jgi:hypothetical protein
MRLPAVRDRLSDLGMEAAPPNSAEQFASLVHGELQRWTRFVKTTGLKAD